MEAFFRNEPGHVRPKMEMCTGTIDPPPEALPPPVEPFAIDVGEELSEKMEVNLNDIEVSPPRPFKMYWLMQQIGPNTSSINLNYCYWVSGDNILKMLSRSGSSLKHLHLIQCQLDERCVAAITRLNLESLSIAYDVNWRVFFNLRHNRRNNTQPRCFKNLKYFSIFINQTLQHRDYTAVRDLYNNVFKYCGEVETLSIMVGSIGHDGGERNWHSSLLKPRHQKRPGLLPNVNKLIIDMPNYAFMVEDLELIFGDIFSEDRIQLKYGSFGKSLAEYYIFGKKVYLRNPPLLEDPSTLIVWSNIYDTNIIRKKEEYSTILRETKFKKIFFNRSLSRTDIETAFLEGLSKNGNHVKEFRFDINSIGQVYGILSRIAKEGNRLEILDVSKMVISGTSRSDLVFSGFFELLLNFKNLRVLLLSGHLFQQGYVMNTTDGRPEKCSWFELVAKKCVKLEELRIEYPFYEDIYLERNLLPNIHAGNLNNISYCQNLKVLALINVKKTAGEPFTLNTITYHCRHLEEIYLINFHKIKQTDQKSFVKYAKNLKTLSMSFVEKVYLYQAIFYQLYECEKLERLSLGKNAIIHGPKVPIITNLLDRVKTLYALVVRERFNLRDETRVTLIREFTNAGATRTGFYVDTGIYKKPYLTPEVHMDLYQ